MKKTFESTPLAMLISSVVISLASAVARIFISRELLDAAHGVYKYGSILPTLYHALLALAIVALIVIAVAKAPKRAPDYVRPHSDITIFASCTCAFLLLAHLLVALYNIVVNRTPASTFDIIEMCFSVPAILYFLGLVRSQTKRSTALALTSFFPIAWCAVCLIRIYFDNSLLQVSPHKIIGEIAFLSAMIYFLSESRAQLGAMKHRLYLASAAAAPIMLLMSALPNLFCANTFSIGSSDSFMRYAVEVALALFIWARLAAYAKTEAEL